VGAFVGSHRVDRPTDIIEFEGVGTVTIKRKLSHGEVESLSVDDAKAMDEGQTSIPLMQIAIVEWDFVDDETNEVAPITPEFLRDLDVKISTKIMEEIQARVPLEEKAQTKTKT